jgi:hypothetical protein
LFVRLFFQSSAGASSGRSTTGKNKTFAKKLLFQSGLEGDVNFKMDPA